MKPKRRERKREGERTVGEGSNDGGAPGAVVLEDLFDGARAGRWHFSQFVCNLIYIFVKTVGTD